MRSGGEVDVVYYLQIKAPMERGADVASPSERRLKSALKPSGPTSWSGTSNSNATVTVENVLRTTSFTSQ